jgi:hypothetical protein
MQDGRENSKQNYELAQPEHLLKEYELCWQGVQHHNTRLWTSASIFVTGGILALTWLGTRPLAYQNWNQFAIVAIIALAIGVVLSLYLKIFGDWEFLDRVEFYRAEEIEKHLKLWRIRYRLHSREPPSSSEEDHERLEATREAIASKLGIPKNHLLNLRGANLAFRRIVRVISFASFLLVVWALVITLGWLN